MCNADSDLCTLGRMPEQQEDAMFGFEFLNYGAQILHNKDLEDMREAILSDDDHEVDCTVSDFCRERRRFGGKQTSALRGDLGGKQAG